MIKIGFSFSDRYFWNDRQPGAWKSERIIHAELIGN